jgi:hypothetical protein
VLRSNIRFCNGAHRVFGRLALLLLLLIAGMAPLPAGSQPFPADMCAADRRSSDLGCTANDVDIAAVMVNNGVTSCVAGTQVTLDLSLNLRLNANQRYDIGVFVALDGKSPIVRSTAGGSASCAVTGIPTSPPPLGNLDGNACGDVGNATAFGSSVVTTIPLGRVTVPCTPDATGHLVLPAAVTWANNGSPTSCQAPPAQWVQASSKSNCSAGITTQIPVTVSGRITVAKNTTPSGSSGSFAFNASGPGASPTAFSLAPGQQQVLNTAQLTTTAQVYTVTEQAAAGFDLSSLQCVNDLDNQTHPEFVTVDLSTRTATIRMSSNPTLGLTSATCSFNNTRQSSITVVKNTVGGDAPFQFSGPSPFTITTSGGTGQRVFAAVAPGTYTVSEIVPPGWARSNTVCTDPTGDTTVVGGTATIKLGAGEDVTCTYTDTKLGAIQISKRTVGGDGTFTFTGPQNFQITTTSGAGAPFALPNLAPGTYTITESVPADWQLSGIVCTDPTNDSTTSGSTATINLGPGEAVACTFTDTKQASVIVEKQTLGGDGTFAFTGSQSFAITTTAGNGKNTTAFESVVPGVALSIIESVPSGWTLEKISCQDSGSRTPLGVTIPNGVSVTPAAGQAIVCTFADTKGATLQVLKNAVPQSAQSFAYTLSGPTAPAAFSLVDDGNGANSKVFTDLPAGDYTVTEAPVPGWINTGITCSDVVEPDLGRRTTINRAAASFTAHLRFGQTVDCTFTNTQIQPGTITVHKKAVGGDGVFVFTGTGPGVLTTFTITTSGAEHTGSQPFAGLSAGTYTIAETVPAGWDLAPPPIDCTVTSGSNTTITPNGLNGVSIALGTTGAATDAVSCQFVDIKRGSITIAKSASPQDPQLFTFTTASLVSTTALPPSFQLADNGAPPNSQTFAALVPTIYTVTEAAVPGWRLVDVACTGGSVLTADPATGVALIDLQPGEDVVCTYSNAKNGTITVTKNAIGGAAGDIFAFVGDLAGTIGTGQSLSGGFADGTYAVSEIVPAGWDLANIFCTGGTVIYTGGEGANPTPSFAPGDTTANVTITGAEVVACTFTNVKRGSIRVVKNAQGGDASFDFTGNATFQIVTNGGISENTTAFASVPPGTTYLITETIPAGWRLTGLACSNTSPVDLATATALVNVAPGENVTCTFTDAREGSITITKRIRSGLSGAFTFTVPTTLDPAGSFTLTPAARTVSSSRVFSNVLAGRYTVAESALPAGWSLKGITCTGANSSVDLAARSATIDLAIGQAVECIYDNVASATVTINALSVGGTDTFAFDGSGAGVSGFSVTTTQDSTKTGNTFDPVPPGNVSFVGLGAPGWRLDNVSCFGNTGGVNWVILGATTTIALAEGGSTECIYYYALPSAIIVPPSIAKAFGAASVVVNGATTLTFTLTNPNAGSTVSGVGFTDTLPAGLVVSTPNGLAGSCDGGTITATAGSGSISLASATLSGSASCTFSVNVTGTTTGTKNNTTGAITSVEGGSGGTASASLIVTSAVPPSLPRTPIPTLQEWALLLLGVLMLMTASVTSRRRERD